MKFSLPIKAYQQFEESRRKCLGLSDSLRIQAKSAIGLLLKEKKKEAEKSLLEARATNGKLQDLLNKIPYLNSVGGIHVGVEEYVEAQLLADFIDGKALSTADKLKVNHDAYLGGLCDMSGELLRLGRKHPEKMQTILESISELYQTTLSVTVTRNNSIRGKLEDLERNMKRMEEMLYQHELKYS